MKKLIANRTNELVAYGLMVIGMLVVFLTVTYGTVKFIELLTGNVYL